MSIQAVAWVLEHSQAKLADRLVLIAIANHADARGVNAWPSLPKIAEEAGVHETTVWRSVKVLEELGELTVERRPGKPNRYNLVALNPLQPAKGYPLQPAKGRPPANRNRPLASCNEPPDEMQGEPSEPSRTIALPRRLNDEERRRGAEFVRALRGKA